MVRKFLRDSYRKWLGVLVVSNGEALRQLQRDRFEYQIAGVSDPRIDQEIERRERRRDELLSKLKS
jgi:hypothetical protein